MSLLRNMFKKQDKQLKRVETYKVAYRNMNQDLRIRYQERIEIESSRDFFKNQDTINRCQAALEVLREEKEERAIAEAAEQRRLH